MIDAKTLRARKGLDYPGITICFLCHDGKGNYLFNKRSQESRDERGTWDFGGGGLKCHDTILNTLSGEIKEEYLTNILEYEFLGYRDVHRINDEGEKTHWVGLYFKVLVDVEKVGNGEPHKFDEIAWFKLDNLPSPLHSEILNDIEEFKDKL